MHTRQLPDGSVLEVADVSHCSSCRQPFEVGLFTRTWINCRCAQPQNSGHRIYVCLRPECTRAETYDPPHAIQTGPTADY